MIQLQLEKIFTNYQLLMMQGISAGLPKTAVQNLVMRNTTKTRRDLSEHFGILDGNVLRMPVVMVMWSPWQNIQIFAGEEALPFMAAFLKIKGMVTPPEKYTNHIVQGLVNIANGKDPKVAEFKSVMSTKDKIILPFWNNGPTDDFMKLFELEPCATQVNFSALQYAIKKSQEIINEKSQTIENESD